MKFFNLREILFSQKLALSSVSGAFRRPLLDGLSGADILLVTGCRRSGKTTLLRQFASMLNEDFFYADFDDIRLRDFSDGDFPFLDKLIEEKGLKLLFLDNIDTSRDFGSYIKGKKAQGYRALVSSSLYSVFASLSNSLGSSLVQRELFPFSYGEFCASLGLAPSDDSLSSFLSRGGLPEAVFPQNQAGKDFARFLLSSVLFKDIAVRCGVRDVSSLVRLFVFLASNAAEKFSPSKLTLAIGVKSPTTILEYISFLEDSSLVSFIPCFAPTQKAQSLLPKKVFIRDAAFISSASSSALPDKDSILENRELFENFVFNSLRAFSKEVFYFAGKSGGECDFVLKAGGKTICAQASSSSSTSKIQKKLDGLQEALSFFPGSKGFVVSSSAASHSSLLAALDSYTETPGDKTITPLRPEEIGETLKLYFPAGNKGDAA